MKKSATFIKVIGVAISLVIVAPVFAESAPVYDVDAMPQQFETSASDQQDLPPPPPPGQEGGAFAPVLSKGTVEQRMQRMEQQINNMQSGDNAARLDALQEQIQTLRGQVEQVTHDLQQMQAQQKSMYNDLDKRLSEKTINKPVKPVEPVAQEGDSPGLTPSGKTNRSSSPIAKAETKPVTTNQPNVAEEQQIYQTAYNFIKAKKYDEAVTALQGMLKKYPSGQFAANAHYWLGELYGLMNKHDLALAEFSTVIKTYPDSPRMSDAQLKVGLIYASQSQWSDAKSSFKTVINRYPGTASARLASEQLKQIKQAGH